jgi:hypothetical protein
MQHSQRRIREIISYLHILNIEYLTPQSWCDMVALYMEFNYQSTNALRARRRKKMAKYEIVVNARVSESPLSEIIDLDRQIMSLSRQYREVRELSDYLGRQIVYAKRRKDELERQQTRVTICKPGSSRKKENKKKLEMTPDVADFLQNMSDAKKEEFIAQLQAMMVQDEVVEEGEKE